MTIFCDKEKKSVYAIQWCRNSGFVHPCAEPKRISALHLEVFIELGRGLCMAASTQVDS